MDAMRSTVSPSYVGAIDYRIHVTGSFNFSRNATMNAENILVIHNADVANQYSQYIDQLVVQYSHTSSHRSPQAKQSQQ